MAVRPCGILLAGLLAGFVHAHLVTSVAGAAPAVADRPQGGNDTERSVSLVIRVKPDQLKKVAVDLAEMVRGGQSVGLPWLKEAFGAISAEIVVEDVEPGGGASTAFRASSAGWTGPGRGNAIAAPGGPSEGREPTARTSGQGATPAIDPHYATAAAIIGRHASAIRDGAAALMETLPADQAAELRSQLEQLATTAGSLGRSLDGLLPAKSRADAPRPKR